MPSSTESSRIEGEEDLNSLQSSHDWKAPAHARSIAATREISDLEPTRACLGPMGHPWQGLLFAYTLSCFLRGLALNQGCLPKPCRTMRTANPGLVSPAWTSSPQPDGNPESSGRFSFSFVRRMQNLPHCWKDTLQEVDGRPSITYVSLFHLAMGLPCVRFSSSDGICHSLNQQYMSLYFIDSLMVLARSHIFRSPV